MASPIVAQFLNEFNKSAEDHRDEFVVELVHHGATNISPVSLNEAGGPNERVLTFELKGMNFHAYIHSGTALVEVIEDISDEPVDDVQGVGDVLAWIRSVRTSKVEDITRQIQDLEKKKSQILRWINEP